VPKTKDEDKTNEIPEILCSENLSSLVFNRLTHVLAVGLARLGEAAAMEEPGSADTTAAAKVFS
jgi:hypothetical protein